MYNLRNFQEFVRKRKRTVKMGLETLNYRSLQLWSILPENLTGYVSLKKALGNGIVLTVCRLSQLYLANTGFL